MLIGTTHKGEGAELRAELGTGTPAGERGPMSKAQVSAKSGDTQRTGPRTERALPGDAAVRLPSIWQHQWLQQCAEWERMIEQLWSVLIFLLKLLRVERWCGRCCFLKSPWSSELALAPARCPRREVTPCSNTPQRCTELPKHTTTSCSFGCAHYCLGLGKTPNYPMRKVIFFFILSAERNDQTEQEERREIKQRLTRKVKSCNICYELLEI